VIKKLLEIIFSDKKIRKIGQNGSVMDVFGLTRYKKNKGKVLVESEPSYISKYRRNVVIVKKKKKKKKNQKKPQCKEGWD